VTRAHMRPFPFGAVLAAALATALVAAAPLLDWDRRSLDAARAALPGDTPAVVAVGLDGEDELAVLQLARTSGATDVLGSSLEPLPAPRRARVLEVPAGALLEGSVPPTVLAGRVVIVDLPARAAARAAALAAARAPLPPGRELLAVAAGLLALAGAAAVARARARTSALVLAGAGVTVLVAIAAIAAAAYTAPALELLLVVPLAAFGGLFDRARALGRMLRAITGPLLRATARRGAAAREGVPLVGPALGEILEARGLLVLAVPPSGHEARVVAGWRLGPGDLRPGALDVRRPPFHDGSGIARPGDASALLAMRAAATLLPLSAGGRTEGWLVVAHGGRYTLETASQATLQICDTLAAELAAARLREGRDASRTLLAAAATLDQETETITEAAAQARTCLALLSPAGVTAWKNARFDEILADASDGSGASSDLGRIVALFRRAGEAPLETLERLLASELVRVVASEVGVVASVTRTGGALLVEVDALDGATIEALQPTPLHRRESGPQMVTAATSSAIPAGG
jgi:hypothetical protein